MKRRNLIIGIIGGRAISTTPKAMRLAEAAGREIGLRGATVVCGGEDGVMEVACRGCKKGGGVTIGIMKGKDKRAANKYVDYVILTSMDLARNNIIVWTADGLLAFDGKYGTVSELALALDVEKPVVSWGEQKLFRTDKVRSKNYIHIEGYKVGEMAKIVGRLIRMIRYSRGKGG